MKNKYRFDEEIQKLELTFEASTIDDMIRQLRFIAEQMEMVQDEEAFEDEEDGFSSYAEEWGEDEDPGDGLVRCDGIHHCWIKG